MAELLAVGGFLIVFLIEKVIFLKDESWNQGRVKPIELMKEIKIETDNAEKKNRPMAK